MTCHRFGNAIICGPDMQEFLCFEHTTYLLEWRGYCGPGVRKWPEDTEVELSEDSHLWGYIFEWIRIRRFK